MLESYIHPSAVIGNGNRIGGGVSIGPNVKIGDNNWIGPHTSIDGCVQIGDNNVIQGGCRIGGVSNHVVRGSHELRAALEATHGLIQIGSANILGECVTVHRPVLSQTTVNSEVNIGSHCHVAHDVLIEDKCILAVGVAIGGYVRLLHGSNLGQNASIHPRVTIGQYSMVGQGSVVLNHVLPGATVAGNPASFLHPNIRGFERHQLTDEARNLLVALLQGDTPSWRELSKVEPNIVSRFHWSVFVLEKSKQSPTIPIDYRDIEIVGGAYS